MIRRRSMPSTLNTTKLQMVSNKIYSNDKNYIFKVVQHKNFFLRKTLRSLPLASEPERYGQLPENVLKKISSYLVPIDQIHLQQTCRRFCDLFSKWKNISAMEIRLKEYTYCSNFCLFLKFYFFLLLVQYF